MPRFRLNVHDPAQSFVLRSYTAHEFRNQHVSIAGLVPQYGVHNYYVCARSRLKKRTKTYSKELCRVS